MREAGKVRREHEALAFVECIADVMKPGKLTWFSRSANLGESETVLFSRIIHATRSRRRENADRSPYRRHGSGIHAFRQQAHAVCGSEVSTEL